jgi:glycosyltransferase involved in cell wall biosynthesis
MLGWALNEEESIGPYIDRAGAFLSTLTDDFELILIDDGSTNRTWEIIQEYRRTRPLVRAYQNDGNRGPGSNTKGAIGLATKDYLFRQTVNWAHDIAAIPQAWPMLGQFNRLFDTRSDTPHKALVSYVNYGLIPVLLGIPLGDYKNVTITLSC